MESLQGTSPCRWGGCVDIRAEGQFVLAGQLWRHRGSSRAIHLTSYRLRIPLTCSFQNDQERSLLTVARRECESAGRGGMLRKAEERLRAETMQVQSILLSFHLHGNQLRWPYVPQTI